MKYGIILGAPSIEGQIATAKRAEAAGFESAWTIEFFNSHGLVRLAAVVEVDRGRGQLGQPDHEVDVGERIVGRPAPAAPLAAPVHESAEREPVVVLRGRLQPRGIAGTPVSPLCERRRGDGQDHQRPDDEL